MQRTFLFMQSKSIHTEILQALVSDVSSLQEHSPRTIEAHSEVCSLAFLSYLMNVIHHLLLPDITTYCPFLYSYCNNWAACNLFPVKVHVHRAIISTLRIHSLCEQSCNAFLWCHVAFWARGVSNSTLLIYIKLATLCNVAHLESQRKVLN